MKKLKWLTAVCLVLSFGFILSGLVKKTTTTASANSLQGFVDWDTYNKIFYAYQNNIIIASEGTGTTVYLDKGQVGVFDSADKSLAEIYAENEQAHEQVAPADGADLSSWSIVLGGEDIDGEPEINSTMNVLMLGGSIKNIYAGHSALQDETNNRLVGKVVVNIVAGSIDSIYADRGYELAGKVGISDGSTDITFNIAGGVIQNIYRDRPNAQKAFNSVLNLTGDVRIEKGIKFENSNSGLGINVGDLGDYALIGIDLNNDAFKKSDMLFSLIPTLNGVFDTNKIKLSNGPQNSASWQIYVLNKTFVQFGVNDPITGVSVQGTKKVGETLFVVADSADGNASIEGVTWFRKDAYLNGASTIIGSGLTYTLKPEDGGKTIFAEVRDKNNHTKKWVVNVDGVIKRIDLPSVVTSNEQTTIYANGNDLLISAEGNGTTVYLDSGEIGVLDALDVSLKDAEISNAFNDGADLSDVIVSAGCSNNKNSGDIAVTILSGKVKEIVTKSTNGEKLISNIVINLFGGNIERVVASKQNVKLETYLNIAGDVKATIFSVQHTEGPTNVKLLNQITSPDASIKFVVDKTQINSDDILKSENINLIDLNKFEFIDGFGKKLNTYSAQITQTGVKLAAIPANSVEIEGIFKVGEVLLAKVNPENANVEFKWFRSETKSLSDAIEIQGATSKTYTLSKEDVGMFVFVVVDDGLAQKVAVSENKVKRAGLSAGIIVLIVVSSVVVAVLIAAVVWFVLWKKNIAKASFMKIVFEKIDEMLSKKQK